MSYHPDRGYRPDPRPSGVTGGPPPDQAPEAPMPRVPRGAPNSPGCLLWLGVTVGLAGFWALLVQSDMDYRDLVQLVLFAVATAVGFGTMAAREPKLRRGTVIAFGIIAALGTNLLVPGLLCLVTYPASGQDPIGMVGCYAMIGISLPAVFSFVPIVLTARSHHTLAAASLLALGLGALLLQLLACVPLFGAAIFAFAARNSEDPAPAS
ncbi:MAG: hypothetical protein R3C39_00595 [Dehalococcoidia bacterium]